MKGGLQQHAGELQWVGDEKDKMNVLLQKDAVLTSGHRQVTATSCE